MIYVQFMKNVKMYALYSLVKFVLVVLIEINVICNPIHLYAIFNAP